MKLDDVSLCGTGESLQRSRRHPYIGPKGCLSPGQKRAFLKKVNRGRARQGEAVRMRYYFELESDGAAMEALARAAVMVMEHGTLKPWEKEGRAQSPKPEGYDAFLAWAEDVELLGYNSETGMEAGLLEIAYPLRFFDKRPDARFPLATLLMAGASEPVSAFSFYQGSRVVDIALPAVLRNRLPGPKWPHCRVREYLEAEEKEPLIGTIVKPKTGLTPEIFSDCVLEAALAGARFTKADENMHLTLEDIPLYVGRVASDLHKAGFDLSRDPVARGRRFLFAPHITTDADLLPDYARAAVEAGANALMFSPYYAGGFQRMQDVAQELDVPIYAHTAGMNMLTGSPCAGMDPRVCYMLTGLFGGAFMQITTMGGYLKPRDEEKPEILRTLDREGLEGTQGMTLAIAGGLGPGNVGRSMQQLGSANRLLLAGTSVYSHPDGPRAGVEALSLGARAFLDEGIVDKAALLDYAGKQGARGACLSRGLLG